MALASTRSLASSRPVISINRKAVAPVVCKASKDENIVSKLAMPMALSVALLASGVVPEEAMAAKSSGRVGGSSGFKSRRMDSGAVGPASRSRAGTSLMTQSSASRRPVSRSTSTSTSSNTTVINRTVVVQQPVMAPPVVVAPVSPFGFGGFGFGGFSLMPTFIMPIPFFGGLFQFFFLMIIVSVVFSVIRGFFGGNNNNSNNKKDDGWGDL